MGKNALAALRSAVDRVSDPEDTELPEYLTEDQARSIKRKFSQRDAALKDCEAIIDAAAADKRELTPEEIEHKGRYLATIERYDDDIRSIEKKAKRAHNEAKAAEVRVGLGIGNLAAGTFGQNVKVTLEHRTYEKGNGLSYLQDLCAVAMGAGVGMRYFQGVEHLQAHARENHVEALEAEAKGSVRTKEQEYFLRQMVESTNPRTSPVYGGSTRVGGLTSYRALSTTNGAGGEFTPPMYLTLDWLVFARAGRVFADAMHKEPLPDGTMSINIPKVYGGTSVATQGSQNTNVSDTDLQTEFVTVPVYTKAGAQIVSLQLLERSPIEFDQLVFMDLGLALAQNVDIACINGTGVNDVTGYLNTTGINTVTWTQASPTIKGFYGQVEQAKVDVANLRFLPATHAFMTPSRWGWLEQSVDSNNRPLVVPEYNGQWNVMATAPPAAVAQGLTGAKFLGLDVYQDANIPSNLGTGTNQDAIPVSHMDDNWLLESPIVTRALPQTYGAQLSVLLQVYEYIAATFARYPVSNSALVGTGLTTPSFNS
jgi:HK97 family phage major capsid protein